MKRTDWTASYRGFRVVRRHYKRSIEAKHSSDCSDRLPKSYKPTKRTIKRLAKRKPEAEQFDDGSACWSEDFAYFAAWMTCAKPKPKPFSWPLARTRLGFIVEPRERLPDDQLCGLEESSSRWHLDIANGHCPPKRTGRTVKVNRKRWTAWQFIADGYGPRRKPKQKKPKFFGLLPTNPNTKPDDRLRVKAKHSVVNGRWKYVVIRVRDVGEVLKRHATASHRDNVARCDADGRTTTLERLPPNLPCEAEQAEQAEIVEIARRELGVIAELLEAGKPKAEIARLTGLSRRTVSQRIEDFAMAYQ